MPVVVIGWILLIPSFLMMGSSVLTCAGIGSAVSSIENEVDYTYVAIQPALTDAQIQTLEDSPYDDPSDLIPSLSLEQISAIETLRDINLAGDVGTGMAAGVMGFAGFCGFIGGLVGGLLGWLLVMKKKVLKCNGCGAIVERA
jgi:hypothetical protein